MSVLKLLTFKIRCLKCEISLCCPFNILFQICYAKHIIYLCYLVVFLVFFFFKKVKLITPGLKYVILKNLWHLFDRYCHEVLKPCFTDWKTGPKWRSMTLLQPGLIFLLHHHHQRLFVLFIKLLMQEFFSFPFLCLPCNGRCYSHPEQVFKEVLRGWVKKEFLTQMFCAMWEFCPL